MLFITNTDFSSVALALPAMSALVAVLLTPLLRNLAIKQGLTDKPDHRKHHVKPVPLAGGVMIAVSALTITAVCTHGLPKCNDISTIITGAVIMVLTGLFDDKADIKPVFKLMIQLGVAAWLWSTGIGIRSMYGIWGIETLSYYQQAILTILTITGTINAFNLWDGIDGLAGGMALVCLSLFSGLALLFRIDHLAVLLLSVCGALVVFLRYNLSQRFKIFMGDAGSLFLGFVIVVSGILLLQKTQGSHQELPVFILVAGVLALPVLDSVRVYLCRIINGCSPFKADRNHLHHLVLSLGFGHLKTTLLILGLVILMLVKAILFHLIFSSTIALIAITLLFGMITTLLRINNGILVWRNKLRQIEH